jgi:hypothetical protein
MSINRASPSHILAHRVKLKQVQSQFISILTGDQDKYLARVPTNCCTGVGGMQ